MSILLIEAFTYTSLLVFFPFLLRRLEQLLIITNKIHTPLFIVRMSNKSNKGQNRVIGTCTVELRQLPVSRRNVKIRCVATATPFKKNSGS